MTHPVVEILRQYPASLLFPVGATSVAYLALKAFRPASTREMTVAVRAIWLGSAAGFVAAFLYVYADISGWAVLLAPFLLGPILMTALITGAVLVAASLALKFLTQLTRS